MKYIKEYYNSVIKGMTDYEYYEQIFKILIPINKNTTEKTLKISFTCISTCPGASECTKPNGLYKCYGLKGNYKRLETFISKSHLHNTALSLDTRYAPAIYSALRRKRSYKVFRSNDTGDIYSLGYLDKLIKIAELLPNKLIYAYSKCVHIVKKRSLPNNLIIRFSLGGRYDSMIDLNTDLHARVFKTERALLDAGYTDGSHNDAIALNRGIVKLGLVEH